MKLSGNTKMVILFLIIYFINVAAFWHDYKWKSFLFVAATFAILLLITPIINKLLDKWFDE